MRAPRDVGHAGKVDSKWSGVCAPQVVLGRTKKEDGSLPILLSRPGVRSETPRRAAGCLATNSR